MVFIGGIDRSDIHKYYDCADIFILCNRTWNSKIEGLPNVAIESMARSTPVIGSKNTGTAVSYTHLTLPTIYSV